MSSPHLLIRASVAALPIVFAATIAGATLHIVPDEYMTIQLAIDAAADGDSVMIRSGNYVESLTLSGKDITLFGESDAASTVIHGFGPYRLLGLGLGVTAATLLENLTFTEGAADKGGALRLADGASPTIRRCRFVENVAQHPNFMAEGGAIYAGAGSDLLIEDCHFEGNSAISPSMGGNALGGAINMWYLTRLTVRRSTFIRNTAVCPLIDHGGAIYTNGDSCLIEDCHFDDNSCSDVSGGAIFASGQNVTVTACTFTGNSAPSSGGAIYGYHPRRLVIEHSLFVLNEGLSTISGYGAIEFELANNTIVHNSQDAVRVYTGGSRLRNNIIALNGGIGIRCLGAVPPDSAIACNDVWGNEQNYGGDCSDLTGLFGNISLDPLFCDSELPDLDLTLHADSPCLPEANECGLVGALGLGCGATAIPERESRVRPSALSIRPNPVVTRATFMVAGRAGQALEIYDPLGRLVDLLPPDGQATLTWSPETSAPSGVYFARLQGDGTSRVVKFMLIR